jgi:hypothetical protein
MRNLVANGAEPAIANVRLHGGFRRVSVIAQRTSKDRLWPLLEATFRSAKGLSSSTCIKGRGEKQAIREVVESSIIWRDARMWDRLHTVWDKDGMMIATWFQGTIDEFIEANKRSNERGFRALHFPGGISIDVKDKRAISQVKAAISQRDMVENVLCDVVSTTRFYDFLEKREGKWELCCAANL